MNHHVEDEAGKDWMRKRTDKPTVPGDIIMHHRLESGEGEGCETHLSSDSPRIHSILEGKTMCRREGHPRAHVVHS